MRVPRRQPVAARALRLAARAFTLLELMVAVTVSLILVGFLFQILSSSLTTWTRSEQRTDAFREARAALQIMARDLGHAVALPKPPGGFPAAGPNARSLVLDRPSGGPQAGEENNEEVYCLTVIPNSGASGLCAVGYYCEWDSNRRAFVLKRLFLDSDKTFDRFKTAAGSSTNHVFTFNELYDRNANPSPVSDLAAYVWDLKFRIDTSLTETDGTRSQPPADHSAPPRKYSAAMSPFPDTLPPFVEIRFKALSPTAARQLASNGNVSKQTSSDPNQSIYRNIILPGMQQFVLRVPLANATNP